MLSYPVTDSERFEIASDHFNAGRYFEAHEEWEELWHMSTGARHAYLQGLIQIAVALHHARNGNLRGTRKLFARSLEYLGRPGAGEFEVDIERLRDSVLSFELAIQRGDFDEAADLPFFSLPRR